MSLPLPDRVDPWRMAEGGKILEGSVALSDLPRLAPVVVAGGVAAYRLAFGREDGRAVVSGRVRAELVLCCQRCLEPLRIAVDSAFDLAFVTGLEEAAALPERYEPAVVEEGSVRPLELVEDELLLSVPAVPLHDSGQCEAPAAAAEAAQGASLDGRPFAVLASLRRGGGVDKH